METSLITLAKEFGLNNALLIIAVVYFVRENRSIKERIVQVLEQLSQTFKTRIEAEETLKKLDSKEFENRFDKLECCLAEIKQGIKDVATKLDSKAS